MANLPYFIGQLLRETGNALDRMGMRMRSNYNFLQPLLRHRQLQNVKSDAPYLHPQSSFCAHNATLIGSVSVDRNATIFYNAILRSDTYAKQAIRVDEGAVLCDRVMVQPGAEIHKNVVVDTGAVVGRLTKIGQGSYVGVAAVLGKNCRLGSQCMVEAGSVLENGTVVEDKEVWAGNPAQKVGDVTDQDLIRIKNLRDTVSQVALSHRKSWEALATPAKP